MISADLSPPLSIYQAIILGLVQGLTEFFPVSSSAHLRMAKWLMGIDDGAHFVRFDLIVHSGTLLALLIYLRHDVLAVLKSVKKMAVFSFALAPLVPAYFLLKPVRMAASEPKYLGFALMITGCILFAASCKKEKPLHWTHPFWIGLAQSVALIPGISRSGSTIAAAKFCGMDWKNGAKFSFLLAIPTIIGGELLESLKVGGDDQIPTTCYLVGFLVAFGVGLFAVRLIFWVYEKEKIKPFAVYCLSIGFFAWMMLK